MPKNGVADDDAGRPFTGGTEGFQCVDVGFGDACCRMDLSVHDYQHATACCLFIRSDPHGLPDVHGTVRADCSCGTHSTSQDYRLIRVKRKLQEKGGFFQGICTVSDDDTVYIFPCRCLRNTLCQPQPDTFLHVFAVNVAQLFPGELRQVF